ncbi:MAG TPA: hypothetical protein VGJ86_24595 [Acidimicrobiales bacterium]|jgi:hypothetical protein
MTKANQGNRHGKTPSQAGIAPDEPVHLIINGHKHLLESPLREQILAVCRPALVLANLDLDTPTHHVAQAGNDIDV